MKAPDFICNQLWTYVLTVAYMSGFFKKKIILVYENVLNNILLLNVAVIFHIENESIATQRDGTCLAIGYYSLACLLAC
jgi:hypothetical protein